jgi:Trk K+ transport system NAD-binding subunit
VVEAPSPARDTDLRDHIIVCGSDHLGIRTVQELQLRDQRVVLIAEAADSSVEIEHLEGVAVIRGDQRRDRVLRQAGVQDAAAIVLTTDSDLSNMHAALAAHDLNPGLRIVIRLFDAELGSNLPALFPNAVALSSSALAAPGFVSGALDGEGGGTFELGGRIFAVRQTADGSGVSPGGQVGADVADTLPIALLRADRTVELLPDVAPTDPGAIVVDAREVAEDRRRRGEAARNERGRHVAGASSGPPRPSLAARIQERLRQVPAGFGGGISSPDRRLLNLALVIVILAAISAVYFQFVSRLSPLDGLSYAFSLLTGTGREIANVDVQNAPVTLKVYAIVLSLCGAAIVGVVYALITDAVIGSRLLRTLGRRPVPGSIRDHVIVCGLGAVGYRIALGIVERGVRVVAAEVEEHERFVSAARAIGIPVVIGDARQPEILRQLGIRTARAVVCATNDDLVNLESALNARAVRPDIRVVVRVFDPDFALRVQKGFGIRFTRSVSHLAAPAFAAAALGSEVIATVPVGDRRVILFARVHVPAGSPLEGQTVGSLDRAGECRILGTVGPGISATRWRPAPDLTLAPDEDLFVAATRAGLAGLLDLSRTPGVPEAAAVT